MEVIDDLIGVGQRFPDWLRLCFWVRVKEHLDQVLNLALVSWAVSILGLWFPFTHQRTKISIGYINSPNLPLTYISLKIIKIIINSYSFYSVTLKEVKKSYI